MTIPATKYSQAINSPPKIIQRMFPKQPILVPFFIIYGNIWSSESRTKFTLVLPSRDKCRTEFSAKVEKNNLRTHFFANFVSLLYEQPP